MGLKQFVKTRYSISKDKKELNSIERIGGELNNLRYKNDLSIENLFESGDTEKMWSDSKKQIDSFSIPDGSGGVNPGDRKALYYLICKVQPSSVLEVGTHIGASTLHIASALYMSQIKNGKKANLTTVDIADVNSTVNKPWLNYGMKYSPVEMINKLNYGSFVEFVADTSIHYAANCKQKYDFIFLDGSHAASIVYQEIPMALNLLNPNGVILLHDYFPGMKPLWSDGIIIPGPYLATERLVEEGLNVVVLPIGKLPWPTKLASNVTSLALLLRKK
ncbi:MAG: class I SAM-dependent methyltransferase [Ginsengibacter sp.]